jgi:AbrB family looped-hinge helix DNA binding protein
MAQYYSRVTRKGQATIPSPLRKRFGIEEGDRVVFEETDAGLVLRPAADIEDSAGALSRFADAQEVVDELLRDRRKSFR